MFLAEQPVPEVTSLQPVTGALTSKVVVVSPFKSSPWAKVEIQAPAGQIESARIDYVCFIWNDCVIPTSIANLQPGDTVTLLLTNNIRLHGDNVYVWGFRQGQSELVSFEEVSASYAAQRKRYLQMFGGVAAAGLLTELVFFIVGYVRKDNRRHP
jgi:hypothetical protein